MITDGLQRRYLVGINERRYDLDFTTPIELVLLVPASWEEEPSEIDSYGDELVVIGLPDVIEKRFANRSWSRLVEDLIRYLQLHSPIDKEKLYSFKTDWSKADIFAKTKAISNMVKLEDDLYISINYTATHSSWIIGDICRLYGIKDGMLIIHRPPASELIEIKKEVGEKRRREFKEFLMNEKGKNEQQADRIVENIQSLNKILVKMGTSYNDFFLFDETFALSNYKSRLLKDHRKYVVWNESQIKAVNIYLNYITEFYTKLSKEAKKNNELLEYHFSIM